MITNKLLKKIIAVNITIIFLTFELMWTSGYCDVVDDLRSKKKIDQSPNVMYNSGGWGTVSDVGVTGGVTTVQDGNQTYVYSKEKDLVAIQDKESGVTAVIKKDPQKADKAEVTFYDSSKNEIKKADLEKTDIQGFFKLCREKVKNGEQLSVEAKNGVEQGAKKSEQDGLSLANALPADISQQGLSQLVDVNSWQKEMLSSNPQKQSEMLSGAGISFEQAKEFSKETQQKVAEYLKVKDKKNDESGVTVKGLSDNTSVLDIFVDKMRAGTTFVMAGIVKLFAAREKNKKEGTESQININDIQKAAKAGGVELSASQTDVQGLNEALKSGPVIAHLDNGNNEELFVVVTAVQNGKVSIIDADGQSREIMSEEDFLAKWTGKLLSQNTVGQELSGEQKEQTKGRFFAKFLSVIRNVFKGNTADSVKNYKGNSDNKSPAQSEKLSLELENAGLNAEEAIKAAKLAIAAARPSGNNIWGKILKKSAEKALIEIIKDPETNTKVLEVLSQNGNKNVAKAARTAKESRAPPVEAVAGTHTEGVTGQGESQKPVVTGTESTQSEAAVATTNIVTWLEDYNKADAATQAVMLTDMAKTLGLSAEDIAKFATKTAEQIQSIITYLQTQGEDVINCAVDALKTVFTLNGILSGKSEIAADMVLVDILTGNLDTASSANYDASKIQLSEFSIQKAAAKRGLKLEGYNTDINGLEAAAADGKGAIVNINAGNGVGHFVVVNEIKDGNVTYTDSDGKKYTVTEGAFKANWSGNVLSRKEIQGTKLDISGLQQIKGARRWNPIKAFRDHVIKPINKYIGQPLYNYVIKPIVIPVVIPVVAIVAAPFLIPSIIMTAVIIAPIINNHQLNMALGKVLNFEVFGVKLGTVAQIASSVVASTFGKAFPPLAAACAAINAGMAYTMTYQEVYAQTGNRGLASSAAKRIAWITFAMTLLAALTMPSGGAENAATQAGTHVLEEGAKIGVEQCIVEGSKFAIQDFLIQSGLQALSSMALNAGMQYVLTGHVDMRQVLVSGAVAFGTYGVMYGLNSTLGGTFGNSSTMQNIKYGVNLTGQGLSLYTSNLQIQYLNTTYQMQTLYEKSQKEGLSGRERQYYGYLENKQSDLGGQLDKLGKINAGFSIVNSLTNINAGINQFNNDPAVKHSFAADSKFYLNTAFAINQTQVAVNTMRGTSSTGTELITSNLSTAWTGATNMYTSWSVPSPATFVSNTAQIISGFTNAVQTGVESRLAEEMYGKDLSELTTKERQKIEERAFSENAGYRLAMGVGAGADIAGSITYFANNTEFSPVGGNSIDQFMSGIERNVSSIISNTLLISGISHRSQSLITVSKLTGEIFNYGASAHEAAHTIDSISLFSQTEGSVNDRLSAVDQYFTADFYNSMGDNFKKSGQTADGHSWTVESGVSKRNLTGIKINGAQVGSTQKYSITIDNKKTSEVEVARNENGAYIGKVVNTNGIVTINSLNGNVFLADDGDKLGLNIDNGALILQRRGNTVSVISDNGQFVNVGYQEVAVQPTAIPFGNGTIVPDTAKNILITNNNLTDYQRNILATAGITERTEYYNDGNYLGFSSDRVVKVNGLNEKVRTLITSDGKVFIDKSDSDKFTEIQEVKTPRNIDARNRSELFAFNAYDTITDITIEGKNGQKLDDIQKAAAAGLGMTDRTVYSLGHTELGFSMSDTLASGEKRETFYSADNSPLYMVSNKDGKKSLMVFANERTEDGKTSLVMRNGQTISVINGKVVGTENGDYNSESIYAENVANAKDDKKINLIATLSDNRTSGTSSGGPATGSPEDSLFGNIDSAHGVQSVKVTASKVTVMTDLGEFSYSLSLLDISMSVAYIDSDNKVIGTASKSDETGNINLIYKGPNSSINAETIVMDNGTYSSAIKTTITPVITTDGSDVYTREITATKTGISDSVYGYQADKLGSGSDNTAKIIIGKEVVGKDGDQFSRLLATDKDTGKEIRAVFTGSDTKYVERNGTPDSDIALSGIGNTMFYYDNEKSEVVRLDINSESKSYTSSSVSGTLGTRYINEKEDNIFRLNDPMEVKTNNTEYAIESMSLSKVGDGLSINLNGINAEITSINNKNEWLSVAKGNSKYIPGQNGTGTSVVSSGSRIYGSFTNADGTQSWRELETGDKVGDFNVTKNADSVYTLSLADGKGISLTGASDKLSGNVSTLILHTEQSSDNKTVLKLDTSANADINVTFNNQSLTLLGGAEVALGKDQDGNLKAQIVDGKVQIKADQQIFIESAKGSGGSSVKSQTRAVIETVKSEDKKEVLGYNVSGGVVSISNGQFVVVGEGTVFLTGSVLADGHKVVKGNIELVSNNKYVAEDGTARTEMSSSKGTDWNDYDGKGIVAAGFTASAGNELEVEKGLKSTIKSGQVVSIYDVKNHEINYQKDEKGNLSPKIVRTEYQNVVAIVDAHNSDDNVDAQVIYKINGTNYADEKIKDTVEYNVSYKINGKDAALKDRSPDGTLLLSDGSGFYTVNNDGVNKITADNKFSYAQSYESVDNENLQINIKYSINSKGELVKSNSGKLDGKSIAGNKAIKLLDNNGNVSGKSAVFLADKKASSFFGMYDSNTVSINANNNHLTIKGGLFAGIENKDNNQSIKMYADMEFDEHGKIIKDDNSLEYNVGGNEITLPLKADRNNPGRFDVLSADEYANRLNSSNLDGNEVLKRVSTYQELINTDFKGKYENSQDIKYSIKGIEFGENGLNVLADVHLDGGETLSGINRRVESSGIGVAGENNTGKVEINSKLRITDGIKEGTWDIENPSNSRASFTVKISGQEILTNNIQGMQFSSFDAGTLVVPGEGGFTYNGEKVIEGVAISISGKVVSGGINIMRDGGILDNLQYTTKDSIIKETLTINNSGEGTNFVRRTIGENGSVTVRNGDKTGIDVGNGRYIDTSSVNFSVESTWVQDKKDTITGIANWALGAVIHIAAYNAGNFEMSELARQFENEAINQVIGKNANEPVGVKDMLSAGLKFAILAFEVSAVLDGLAGAFVGFVGIVGVMSVVFESSAKLAFKEILGTLMPSIQPMLSSTWKWLITPEAVSRGWIYGAMAAAPTAFYTFDDGVDFGDFVKIFAAFGAGYVGSNVLNLKTPFSLSGAKAALQSTSGFSRVSVVFPVLSAATSSIVTYNVVSKDGFQLRDVSTIFVAFTLGYFGGSTFNINRVASGLSLGWRLGLLSAASHTLTAIGSNLAAGRNAFEGLTLSGIAIAFGGGFIAGTLIGYVSPGIADAWISKNIDSRFFSYASPKALAKASFESAYNLALFNASPVGLGFNYLMASWKGEDFSLKSYFSSISNGFFYGLFVGPLFPMAIPAMGEAGGFFSRWGEEGAVSALTGGRVTAFIMPKSMFNSFEGANSIVNHIHMVEMVSQYQIAGKIGGEIGSWIDDIFGTGGDKPESGLFATFLSDFSFFLVPTKMGYTYSESRTLQALAKNDSNSIELSAQLIKADGSLEIKDSKGNTAYRLTSEEVNRLKDAAEKVQVATIIRELGSLSSDNIKDIHNLLASDLKEGYGSITFGEAGIIYGGLKDIIVTDKTMDLLTRAVISDIYREGTKDSQDIKKDRYNTGNEILKAHKEGNQYRGYVITDHLANTVKSNELPGVMENIYSQKLNNITKLSKFRDDNKGDLLLVSGCEILINAVNRVENSLDKLSKSMPEYKELINNLKNQKIEMILEGKVEDDKKEYENNLNKLFEAKKVKEIAKLEEELKKNISEISKTIIQNEINRLSVLTISAGLTEKFKFISEDTFASTTSKIDIVNKIASGKVNGKDVSGIVNANSVNERINKNGVENFVSSYITDKDGKSSLVNQITDYLNKDYSRTSLDLENSTKNENELADQFFGGRLFSELTILEQILIKTAIMRSSMERYEFKYNNKDKKTKEEFEKYFRANNDKTMNQMKMLFNGLTGNISALLAGGGKSVIFLEVLSLHSSLVGKDAGVGELIVAKATDIGQYVSGKNYEIAKALGLEMINGSDYYHQPGGKGMEDLKGFYNSKDSNKIIVYDLQTRGFVELASRTGDGSKSLSDALDLLSARAIDEADVAALSKVAFVLGTGEKASEEFVGKVDQLIDIVSKEEIELVRNRAGLDKLNKNGEMGYLVEDNGKIIYSDELLKKITDIEKHPDRTKSMVDNLFRAKYALEHKNKIVGFDKDGNAVPIENGKWQLGTTDNSATYNVACVLLKMRELGGSDAITDSDGRRFDRNNIKISASSGEATLSQVFRRQSGRILTFGGSATVDVAKEIAKSVYGSDAVTVEKRDLNTYRNKASWSRFYVKDFKEYTLSKDGIVAKSEDGIVAKVAIDIIDKIYGGASISRLLVGEYKLDMQKDVFFAVAEEILKRSSSYNKDVFEAFKEKFNSEFALSIIKEQFIKEFGTGENGLNKVGLKANEIMIIDPSAIENTPGIIDKIAQGNDKDFGGKVIFTNESALRAVDFQYIDLIILDAHNFSEGDLLQALGRAGRHKEHYSIITVFSDRDAIDVKVQKAINTINALKSFDGEKLEGNVKNLEDDIIALKDLKGKEADSKKLDIVNKFESLSLKTDSILFKAQTESIQLLLKDVVSSIMMRITNKSELATVKKMYIDIITRSEASLRGTLKDANFNRPEDILAEIFKSQVEFAIKEFDKLLKVVTDKSIKDDLQWRIKELKNADFKEAWKAAKNKDQSESITQAFTDVKSDVIDSIKIGKGPAQQVAEVLAILGQSILPTKDVNGSKSINIKLTDKISSLECSDSVKSNIEKTLRQGGYTYKVEGSGEYLNEKGALIIDQMLQIANPANGNGAQLSSDDKKEFYDILTNFFGLVVDDDSMRSSIAGVSSSVNSSDNNMDSAYKISKYLVENGYDLSTVIDIGKIAPLLKQSGISLTNDEIKSVITAEHSLTMQGMRQNGVSLPNAKALSLLRLIVSKASTDKNIKNTFDPIIKAYDDLEQRINSMQKDSTVFDTWGYKNAIKKFGNLLNPTISDFLNMGGSNIDIKAAMSVLANTDITKSDINNLILLRDKNNKVSKEFIKQVKLSPKDMPLIVNTPKVVSNLNNLNLSGEYTFNDIQSLVSGKKSSVQLVNELAGYPALNVFSRSINWLSENLLVPYMFFLPKALQEKLYIGGAGQYGHAGDEKIYAIAGSLKSDREEVVSQYADVLRRLGSKEGEKIDPRAVAEFMFNYTVGDIVKLAKDKTTGKIDIEKVKQAISIIDITLDIKTVETLALKIDTAQSDVTLVELAAENKLNISTKGSNTVKAYKQLENFTKTIKSLENEGVKLDLSKITYNELQENIFNGNSLVLVSKIVEKDSDAAKIVAEFTAIIEASEQGKKKLLEQAGYNPIAVGDVKAVINKIYGSVDDKKLILAIRLADLTVTAKGAEDVLAKYNSLALAYKDDLPINLLKDSSFNGKEHEAYYNSHNKAVKLVTGKDMEAVDRTGAVNVQVKGDIVIRKENGKTVVSKNFTDKDGNKIWVINADGKTYALKNGEKIIGLTVDAQDKDGKQLKVRYDATTKMVGDDVYFSSRENAKVVNNGDSVVLFDMDNKVYALSKGDSIAQTVDAWSAGNMNSQYTQSEINELNKWNKEWNKEQELKKISISEDDLKGKEAKVDEIINALISEARAGDIALKYLFDSLKEIINAKEDKDVVAFLSNKENKILQAKLLVFAFNKMVKEGVEMYDKMGKPSIDSKYQKIHENTEYNILEFNKVPKKDKILEFNKQIIQMKYLGAGEEEFAYKIPSLGAVLSPKEKEENSKIKRHAEIQQAKQKVYVKYIAEEKDDGTLKVVRDRTYIVGKDGKNISAMVLNDPAKEFVPTVVSLGDVIENVPLRMLSNVENVKKEQINVIAIDDGKKGIGLSYGVDDKGKDIIDNALNIFGENKAEAKELIKLMHTYGLSIEKAAMFINLILDKMDTVKDDFDPTDPLGRKLEPVLIAALKNNLEKITSIYQLVSSNPEMTKALESIFNTLKEGNSIQDASKAAKTTYKAEVDAKEKGIVENILESINPLNILNPKPINVTTQQPKNLAKSGTDVKVIDNAIENAIVNQSVLVIDPAKISDVGAYVDQLLKDKKLVQYLLRNPDTRMNFLRNALIELINNNLNSPQETLHSRKIVFLLTDNDVFANGQVLAHGGETYNSIYMHIDTVLTAIKATSSGRKNNMIALNEIIKHEDRDINNGSHSDDISQENFALVKNLWNKVENKTLGARAVNDAQTDAYAMGNVRKTLYKSVYGVIKPENISLYIAAVLNMCDDEGDLWDSLGVTPKEINSGNVNVHEKYMQKCQEVMVLFEKGKINANDAEVRINLLKVIRNILATDNAGLFESARAELAGGNKINIDVTTSKSTNVYKLQSQVEAYDLKFKDDATKALVDKIYVEWGAEKLKKTAEDIAARNADPLQSGSSPIQNAVEPLASMSVTLMKTFVSNPIRVLSEQDKIENVLDIVLSKGVYELKDRPAINPLKSHKLRTSA